MPKPEQWKGSDLRSRAEVALWLKNHGGEIHDPTGLIVGRMRTELGKGRALSQLLADMESDGMIRREVRGRRTLSIKLLDDWGLADDLSAQSVFRPPRSVESDLRRLNRDGDGSMEGVDLTALAETLLAVCLKRAQAQPSSDRNARTEKLEEQLAKVKADLAETKDALILARESEREHRRQAETMRESLAKFQRSMDKKPAKGTVPLVEQLRPADRRLLEQLMQTVPSRK